MTAYTEPEMDDWIALQYVTHGVKLNGYPYSLQFERLFRQAQSRGFMGGRMSLWNRLLDLLHRNKLPILPTLPKPPTEIVYQLVGEVVT